MKTNARREAHLARYRLAAQDRVVDEEGNTEVDDNAPVSYTGERGAYVQAWVWISREEMKRALR